MYMYAYVGYPHLCHRSLRHPRFDLHIEPVFAVMALYDARERKKISESFHLDCNSSELQHMLDDHMDERSLSSLSRSAIFDITYPNPDVFLIIKASVGGGREGRKEGGKEGGKGRDRRIEGGEGWWEGRMEGRWVFVIIEVKGTMSWLNCGD